MVESEIFAPLSMGYRDPDNVSQSVVEDEMQLFASFTRQSKELGGGS
jgi:hypothetical protein